MEIQIDAIHPSSSLVSNLHHMDNFLFIIVEEILLY